MQMERSYYREPDFGEPVVKVWAEINESEHDLMADSNGNGEEF
jgi:hypothetical protein